MPDNPQRCPVTTYKRYAELRPADFNGNDHPFYLAVKEKKPAKNSDWFKKQPVGINTIGQFLPKMVKLAGVGEGRKITNTSYRKHMASRLNEAHVPKEVGRHVTGHKQASSLDNYAPLCSKQQLMLSKIVGGENMNFFDKEGMATLPKQSMLTKTIDHAVSVPSTTGHEATIVTVPANVHEAASAAIVATVDEVAPAAVLATHEVSPITVPATVPGAMLFPPTLDRQSSTCNTAVNASIHTGQHGLLYGATVNGGTFTFNIHQHHYPAKRRRVNVIESDSE